MAIPENLEYRFRGYSLRKKGGNVEIECRSPVWLDARIPSSQQITVAKITPEDFLEIWGAICKIDFSRYNDLKQSDFIPPPTDVMLGEILRFAIDGKMIVNKSYENLLSGEAAEPLARINEIIGKKFEKKEK
jgi:hypothetical protein